MSKRFDLETAKEVFDYCPQTGKLFWKVKPSNKREIGDEAGYIVKGNWKKGLCKTPYRQVCVRGFKREYTHQVVFLLLEGRGPIGDIDHLNGDGMDNTPGNLRECYGSENQRNKTKYINNTSGFTGVHWVNKPKPWRATAHLKGRTVTIGDFSEIAEAVEARRQFNLKNGFTERHGK